MSRSRSPYPRSVAPLSGYGMLLGSVWLSAFLVSIDYTALNVTLPTLAADFGVGTSDVSWIALAYMLMMVALTPMARLVIDRLGYTRALTGALGLFAISSLASAFAPTFWLLVALRAVQGIGASVMLVIGPALVRTRIPAEAQDRAFAIFSTGPTAGLCAGPAIGGQLTALFGWHSVFLFNVPAALLALLLLRATSRTASNATSQPPSPQAQMPDAVAAVAAIAGLLMLLLGLNQGKEWGWGSADVITLFVGAGVAAIIVATRERRATTPLVDHRIFQSPGFSAAAVAFLLLLLVFGGSVFLLPFYFEWLRGLDTDVVGHVLMVQPAATILVSNLAAFRFAGVSRRTLCLAGIPLFVTGVAVLAGSDRGTPLLVPIIALALMGSGAGLYYPALIQAGLAGVPSGLAASASSLQTAIRVLAQLLGVVLFETVFSQLYPSALEIGRAAAAAGSDLPRMQAAFHAVFYCGTVVATLALIPVLTLSNVSGQPGAATEPVERDGT